MRVSSRAKRHPSGSCPWPKAGAGITPHLQDLLQALWQHPELLHQEQAVPNWEQAQPWAGLRLLSPGNTRCSLAESRDSPPRFIYLDEFTKQLRHFGKCWGADFLPYDRSFLPFFSPVSFWTDKCFMVPQTYFLSAQLLRIHLKMPVELFYHGIF